MNVGSSAPYFTCVQWLFLVSVVLPCLKPSVKIIIMFVNENVSSVCIPTELLFFGLI